MQAEQKYTTDDEIEYLFELADAGKYGTLRTLKTVYKQRNWDGEGMRVDPKRVFRMLDFILERRERAA